MNNIKLPKHPVERIYKTLILDEPIIKFMIHPSGRSISKIEYKYVYFSYLKDTNDQYVSRIILSSFEANKVIPNKHSYRVYDLFQVYYNLSKDEFESYLKTNKQCVATLAKDFYNKNIKYYRGTILENKLEYLKYTYAKLNPEIFI